MKKLLNGLLIATFAVLVGCASGGGNPAVGVWDVEMNTPVGATPVVLTIAADGTGSMVADGMGETAIAGIMVDGNAVTFDADIDAGGQSITLSFSGTVTGDSIEGAFDTDFGAFTVTGTRQ